MKMSNALIVRMSLRAYNTILLHAKTYASLEIPQEEWKIVYGYLSGVIHCKDKHCLTNDITIYDAIPMTHGNYTAVEFGVEEYVNTVRVDIELTEGGYFLLGWYHSHPNKGLFLHDIDIINQLAYQGPNPDAIALVVDQMLVGPNSCGIEIFSLDNTVAGIIPRDPNIKMKLELPRYHTVKWKIEKELDEIKIEGPTINELRVKEFK